LSENHLVYFVSDVVDQLDLLAIKPVHEAGERGYPPYHPRMMTKLLLYRYCLGGIFIAQDPEAIGGRCSFPAVGGGKPARFLHDLGFPQASCAGFAGVTPPVVADHVGDRDDKGEAGGVGREQGEGHASKHQAMSYFLPRSARHTVLFGVFLMSFPVAPDT
jgi:hypothetical protein